MAQRYPELSDKLIEFIGQQKLFFVATAVESGRINLSPKGMDSLRVLSPTRVLWLNATGSGNETAAHVARDPRMTVMFCAFEGAPMILRLYGNARAVHHNDADWADLHAEFKPLPGARQIFDLHIDLVQTSCGFAVPLYDYAGERGILTDWALKKGETGVQDYWRERNQESLDGLPTGIVEKNL